jgi:hypothetical protein
MKKIIFLTFLIGLFHAVTAMPIDSAAIQAGIQTAIQAVNVVDPAIIGGIPNSITGGLLTFVAGILIRFFELRSIKRKHNAEIAAARLK